MSRRTATVYTEQSPGGDDRIAAQLVVIDGPDAGRAIRLCDEESVVGTAAGSDLVLTDDSVSGSHLGIRLRDGRFDIRDLGSKNGVLFEGSAVTAASVAIGATLKLGRSFVRIQPLPRPLEVEPSQSRRFGDLFAESLAMRELFAVLELAAASDATILIEGETGTGKELAARAIHDHSARRGGPFVAVDCGALPESLLDSELFGHVRGAFTGAARSRAGAFSRAHGGTIFLDELGGVPAAVQARLLRVIEERQVKPIGSDDARAVDIRVIAASRGDVEGAVAEGEFRADLFYRLSVVRVTLPPLRSRREDIAIIAREMLRRRGIEPGEIDGPNLDRLIAHDWPGNVRELRNVIDRAVALTPLARCFGDLRIGLTPASADDAAASVRSDLPFADAKELVMRDFERRYLADVLARCGGNISETARETELDRKHLRTLLKRHGLI